MCTSLSWRERKNVQLLQDSLHACMFGRIFSLVVDYKVKLRWMFISAYSYAIKVSRRYRVCSRNSRDKSFYCEGSLYCQVTITIYSYTEKGDICAMVGKVWQQMINF
ncbi:CLUMA_CG008765, isoform A [Clunio marinus]|uniref:CLUMA_CG008765, isoform A n=1 Tax=Clunio marinus TaxID=568069 RepID=A0A1J1I4V3_9DIPT|nr:CLUMA_CG008765, isoform A [Clunio marinus]